MTWFNMIKEDINFDPTKDDITDIVKLICEELKALDYTCEISYARQTLGFVQQADIQTSLSIGGLKIQMPFPNHKAPTGYDRMIITVFTDSWGREETIDFDTELAFITWAQGKKENEENELV